MANILVIDDDPNLRTLYKRFLEGHGHTVDVAANGKEGLSRMNGSDQDLIITDIMMPETDGLEVVMTVQRMSKKVPIIAISGGMRSAAMDFLPMAEKFGAAKVIYKPVDLDDLLAVVEEVLNK